MTVRLSPPDWRCLRSSDTSPAIVFFRCFYCHALGEVASAHIGADGMTTKPVACSNLICGLRHFVLLEGWAAFGQAKAGALEGNTLTCAPGLTIQSVTTGTFPHCDSRVLHAPGECQFCDMYPLAQAQRRDAGLNFTGHHEAGKATCPSELARPLEVIERWPGNRATAPESMCQADGFSQ